jgi:hypothetical protein
MTYTKIGSFLSEPKFQVIGLNKYKINLAKLFVDIQKYMKYSSLITTNCKEKILQFVAPTIKQIKIHKNYKNIYNLIKNLKLNIYYRDNNGKSLISIYDISDLYYSNPHTFSVVKKKKKINTQKFSLTNTNSNILLVSNSPIVNIRLSGILLSCDYHQISYKEFIYTWFHNNNMFDINTLDNVIREVSIDNRDKVIDWIRQEFTGIHTYDLSSYIVHDICNKLEKLKN